MELFLGLTIESLFLVVFGVIIFVSGTTSWRMKRRLQRPNMVYTGEVLWCKHVEKRDTIGNLIQNYYETRVQYTEQGHAQQTTIKSVREFHQNDSIKLYRESPKDTNFRQYEANTATSIAPAAITFGGALIAIMPIVQNKYELFILIALFILAGVVMIVTYQKGRSGNKTILEAEIIDILHFTRGSAKSKFAKQTVSYYPILRYTLHNQVSVMRSRYNSNTKGSYKIGDKKKIYYDEETACIVEKKPSVLMLIGGILLLACALVLIVGILMVACALVGLFSAF